MARSTNQSSTGSVESGYYDPSMNITYIAYYDVVYQLTNNYQILIQGETDNHLHMKTKMFVCLYIVLCICLASINRRYPKQ